MILPSFTSLYTDITLTLICTDTYLYLRALSIDFYHTIIVANTYSKTIKSCILGENTHFFFFHHEHNKSDGAPLMTIPIRMTDGTYLSKLQKGSKCTDIQLKGGCIKLGLGLGLFYFLSCEWVSSQICFKDQCGGCIKLMIQK